MAILDGLSPTGAWSFSRDLLSSWSSSWYSDTSGNITSLNDQTGNGRDLTASGSSRPLLGTAGPNSRACGDFNGSSNVLSGSAINQFIQNGEGYLVVSFIADSVTSGSGTRYNNNGLMADASGYVGLLVDTNGLTPPYNLVAYNYDGNADYSEVAGGVNLDQVHVAEWKHEGGNVSCRLDGGSWSTVSSGNTSNINGGLRLGRGYVNYFDGKVFEAIAFSSIPDEEDQDAIVEELLDWAGGEGPIDDVPVHITQLPIQVIDTGSRTIRVTQLPLQIITLPVQPARVTQLPIQTPNLPRPVPFPLPLVPEIPVTETWSWLTSVNIKDNGKEQRSSLRDIPRKRLRFDFVILGDLSRREVFDILWKYQGREFLYPHYHLSTYVEPTSQGSTSLVFNPAYTDVRDGEQLAIYDSHTETTRYVSVDVVTPTGADLVEPLEFDVGPACLVCSVSTFHLPSSYGLTMDMVSGSSQITLEATESRPLQRTDGSGLLTYYDGYLVLDKRPMNGVEEGYDKNVNWVDNETGHLLPMTKWRPAFSSGKRSYLFDRRESMDYWRAFADQARGRFKSFIMATFFDDLPLTEVPALGTTELVSSNIQANEYLYTRVYRYIRIERVDGSVIFRRVVDKKLIYDANGDPVALRLMLNASIGSAAGNNQIKMVSFAPLTRLDSDEVSLSHGDIDTTISFATRTINE